MPIETNSRINLTFATRDPGEPAVMRKIPEVEIDFRDNKLLECAKLAAATGLRSMSGLNSLADEADSPWRLLVGAARVGEIFVDKFGSIPGRDTPLVMAQRGVLGGWVTHQALAHTEARKKIWPTLAGAALAVGVGFIAAKCRGALAKKMPNPSAQFLAGFIEDMVVAGLVGRH